MSSGQATLDALTFEEDEETRETPVGDEEEQGELSVPTDDALREDADTDENEDATGIGEGEDDTVRRPEDLREAEEGRTDDSSSSTTTSSDGRYGPCKSCGEMSSKCYKCDNCGKPW